MPDFAGNNLLSAREINLATGLQAFSDRIDATDTDDYYRISLSGRSSLNLAINGLSANAGLQLLDRNGNTLQSSANSASITAPINQILDANVYYIRVFQSNSSANTDYSLNITLQNSSKTDIYWRDYSSGANAVWFMGGTNNTTIASSTYLTSVPTTWHIESIADFNGDNRPDLLWRDYGSGANAVWFMGGTNNTTIASSTYLTSIPTTWHIEGTADFNGDNRPDLLWRDYSSGANAVWFMGGTNNTTIASSTYLTSIPSTWHIEGIADFNGDNRPDLLWRDYSSGANAVWFMGGTNNTTIASSTYLTSIPTTWHIEGTADFNGDNRPDLLWRDYSSGANAVWFMGGTNNTTIASSTYLTSVPTTWQALPYTRDSSPVITLTASDATAAETQSGQPANPGQFTFTRSGSSASALTVYYTAAGSAVNGSDYTSIATSITFQAGQSSVALPISILDDALLEGNETVVLTLNANSAYMLGSVTSGTVTIADDESPVITLTASDATAAETQSGQPANPGQFTFTRSGSSASALTVYYTAAGSAVNGSDYTSIATSITFQAGQSSVALPINIINDLLVEGSESIILTLLSNTNYTIGSSAATVTVTDNDPEGNGFNIVFDYQFDTLGWFTLEKRATLEAAAAMWSSIIKDEFTNVAAGTDLYVTNPQTGQSQYLTLNYEIDDLVVFVGARNIDGTNSTLAYGGSSATYTIGSSLDTRYNGSDFEPWTGSITFDLSEKWFFDATPNTANDIPSDANDFLSTAFHELGHILGISNSVKAFSQQVSGGYFYGSNAKALNNNNPIPLSSDLSHIQDNFKAVWMNENAMDPIIMVGTRKLPTFLDIALIDDIGYTVSYSSF